MNRLSFALTILIGSGLLAGCGFFESSDFAVNLVNEDAQAVHILAPGDSFSSSNRLEPSASRFVNFPDSGGEEPKTFRAGTNGQVLQTVTCTPTMSAPSNANVVYRSSGILACVDW